MTAPGVAAIAADDELLDMLGQHGRSPSDDDGQLAQILAAWRRGIHTGTAPAAIHTPGPRRQSRHCPVPVARQPDHPTPRGPS